MIRTLQKKFIFAAMLAITLLLLSMLGSLNVINAILNRRQTDDLLEQLTMAEMAPVPHKTPSKKEREELFRQPMSANVRMSAVYFVVSVNADGEIFRTDVSRIADVDEEQAKILTEKVMASGKKEGRMGEFRYRSRSAPEGKETVWVFLSTAVQTMSALRLLVLSALIGAVCWLLMLLFVRILSGRAIRPIAANIERQKRFVTDAGHEIKTPLAIIMANTEAMELHGGETKWSRNIRDQAIRLNGLMQNLLTLSKIDESNLAETKAELSFSALAADGAEMFREAMELKELHFESRIQPDLTLCANKDLMGRLISILLDNAVKYAPKGGKVVLELFRNEKGNAQLVVANDCENVPDCAPEKLFDRFYRADLARTQKNGGYGIGLSAAQSIVEVHGGTITAAYPDEHTVAFFVFL